MTSDRLISLEKGGRDSTVTIDIFWDTVFFELVEVSSRNSLEMASPSGDSVVETIEVFQDAELFEVIRDIPENWSWNGNW